MSRIASVGTGGLAGGMRGSKAHELIVLQPRPSLLVVVLANLFRLLTRLASRAVRHPLLVTSLVAVLLVWRTGGVLAVVATILGVVLGLWFWWRLHQVSYYRVVVSRLRAFWVYRRCWQPAMHTCGLSAQVNGGEYLPKIRKVIASPYVDRVLVDLLSGQAPEDYEAQVSQLAHTFEALRCRVVVDRPGRVWLEFTHADALTEEVHALAPNERLDLAGLMLGQREDGTPWRLRLLGTHLLIAGATGSGKGSVVWSLVRAMGPAIRDRSVQLWAIDPKGGMELTPGAGLFTRFAYSDPSSMVELLEDAVANMKQRAERLRRAGHRLHQPTPDDPLVVVVVDEMAALTAYAGDRELKKRAEAALQVLLSQGRAPGFLVVAAVQDPGKDVVAFRDLFPSRIALRLLEDVQVDMVLGRSARQHGAVCDHIPASLPGVGYVVLEGVREPVRVRAAYVSDEDLAWMVEEYRPGAEVDSRRAPQGPRSSTPEGRLRVVDG